MMNTNKMQITVPASSKASQARALAVLSALPPEQAADRLVKAVFAAYGERAIAAVKAGDATAEEVAEYLFDRARALLVG